MLDPGNDQVALLWSEAFQCSSILRIDFGLKRRVEWRPGRSRRQFMLARHLRKNRLASDSTDVVANQIKEGPSHISLHRKGMSHVEGSAFRQHATRDLLYQIARIEASARRWRQPTVSPPANRRHTLDNHRFHTCLVTAAATSDEFLRIHDAPPAVDG